MEKTKQAIFIFKAVADKYGLHGCYPGMDLFCVRCGKPLYLDWQYNFTDREAHADCVRDGQLRVEVRIEGLAIYPLGVATTKEKK